MQAIQRIFIIALAFVVTLGAALGSFLFFSLIPYYSLIGKVTAGLVITGLVCVAAILLTFTYTRIGLFFARLRRERLHSNLLVSGEVVVLLHPDGRYDHLSALHEAARHPAQIAGPREDNTVDAASDEQTILELHKKGLGLREIASLTNNSYYKVQKVTSGK